MADYDNTNRGAIWPNDRMREGKQDPHFTGSLNVDGREFWVSAWKRKADSAANAPSLSFTVKPKDEQKMPREEHPSTPEFDDSIPF